MLAAAEIEWEDDRLQIEFDDKGSPNAPTFYEVRCVLTIEFRKLDPFYA